MTAQPLIINKWKEGIADSPHEGIGLIRNADIQAFPGAVKVGKESNSIFQTTVTQTFTANASNDTCTLATATVPLTGTAVTFTTTGTLPAGLSLNTVYFIHKLTTSTFKVATTLDLSLPGTIVVDITDAGTGTHTLNMVAPGTINHIVKLRITSTNIRYYMQDSNSRIWFYSRTGEAEFSDLAGFAFLLTGNTLTNGSGNGIVILTTSDASANYLLAFRNDAIDICNITSSVAATWSNAWESNLNGSTTSTANSHHAIRAQDGIVYFCDGRFVGSLQENSGSVFDPATGGTYTYTNEALDLPVGEIAQWIEELGTNLMIAGNIYNKIYPWDRTSSSFNIPLEVPEVSVKRLKNNGGEMFILAGTKGSIYYTQGTYIQLAKRLPEYVINNSGTLQATVVTWGGISTLNGDILFGAGVLTSGNSGAYRLTASGQLTIDNVPSTSSTTPTAIFVDNEFYLMGYASGADVIGTTRYAAFETVIHSDMYKVATKTEKGTYSELEVVMAKPAATGNIRVSYRFDTSSAFTTLTTNAADGTTTIFTNDIGLTDIDNLQIQVEMDGAVELAELRFIP